MKIQLNLIVNELAKELGDRHFFTIDDLHNFGVFGTKYAVRKALKKGLLSYIQISARRRVIPRSVLLEYLRDNIAISNDYLEECVSNDSKA